MLDAQTKVGHGASHGISTARRSRRPLLRDDAASSSCSPACARWTASTSTSGRGEVHCLLGQNGAGKSHADQGAGRRAPARRGRRSRGRASPSRSATRRRPCELGIATIYQELDLVDGLSVAENIFLGHELHPLGFSQRPPPVGEAAALLARLGHPEISPTPRGRHAVGRVGKQIVSMARALSHDARLIVMDEPSAVLDAGRGRATCSASSAISPPQGVAVIYISHRLEEIRQIGDRVTVLKDGRPSRPGSTRKTTPTARAHPADDRAHHRVRLPARGRGAPTARPCSSRGARPHGEFSGRLLRGPRRVRSSVSPGLVGSGRSEILETIFGARKATTGTVSVDGARLRHGSVPAAVHGRHRAGPEERKSQGLLLDESVYRNITPGHHDPLLARRIRSTATAETTVAPRSCSSRWTCDRPASDRRSRTLSGGNQQKVVLARWLLRGCRVLLLDEPTRGVDVGARTEIYALIRRLADDGVAVVVVSSEVPEVLGLADRVLVLARRPRGPRGSGRRDRRARRARPGDGRETRHERPRHDGRPTPATRRQTRARRRPRPDGRRSGAVPTAPAASPAALGGAARSQPRPGRRLVLLLHRRRHHRR